MRRAVPVATLCAVVLTLATACGGSSSATGGDRAGSTEPVSVDITIGEDSVSPNSERVQVDTGQEVDLVVSAEEPGELHVHSDPEQELAYRGGGEPQTFELTFDRPGIVAVESHDLGLTIVQLEVG